MVRPPYVWDIYIYIKPPLGGKNTQTPSAAGAEADLDAQYAFGLTHPIPVRLVWSYRQVWALIFS